MTRFKITKEVINQINEEIDIFELISDYVVLKKKGSQYVGLCPFHTEKSPSFSVNPSKKLYHCFGCGVGGDGIKFLMDINKRDFKDVVLDLSDKFNISLDILSEDEKQEYQQELNIKKQLYDILSLSQRFYANQLYSDVGKKALLYLYSRGFNDQIIQHFGLGYASEEWNNLFFYLSGKGFSVDSMIKAGVVKISSKGNHIDYFHHRIIIPIYDRNHRIIAFGGRSNGQVQPKYLNSPDTALFNKKETLFAYSHATTTIAKTNQVIVVEGYFDAIALHSQGVKNVVAVLGTAFTKNHLRTLSKIQANEIIFNFDNDKAGYEAIKRALKEVEENAYSGQIDFKILSIPSTFKDPDEFLREQNVDGYIQLTKNATPWFTWMTNELLKEKDLTNPKDYDYVFKALVASLRSITDDSTRSNYINFCSEILAKEKTNNPNLLLIELPRIQANIEKAIGNNKYIQPTQNNFSEKKEEISIEQKITIQCEYSLLLIYLKLCEYRNIIKELLDNRDILFTNNSFRAIWLEILELETKLPPESIEEELSMILFNDFEHRKLLNKLINPPELETLKIVQSPKIISFIEECLYTLDFLRQKRLLSKFILKLKESKTIEDKKEILEQIEKIKTIIIQIKSKTKIPNNF